MPYLPHLLRGNDNTALLGLLCILKEIMHVSTHSTAR